MGIPVATYPVNSIDKVEIHTYLDLKDLRGLWLIEKLGKECRQIILLPAGKKASSWGYRSKISITVPTKRCFAILAWSGLKEYVITYIELANDVFYETEGEAMSESYRLMGLVRKKYTAKTMILDYSDSYNSTKSAYGNGLFSDKTLYLGNDNLKFVLYARISKINAKPCVHSEWRVRGSKNIKDRLDITSFEDCFFFDLNTEYEKLVYEYIVMEEIDTVRLGKYFLGWGKRKNLTRRQKMRVGILAIMILNDAKKGSEGKCTSAQLAEWTKAIKGKIKNEPKEKSDWQKRAMKIQSNNKFCRVVAL